MQWIISSPSYVPCGAIVAGYKADGKPLYVAQIYDHDQSVRGWYPGNYDPDKHCAEYLIYIDGWNETIGCGNDWKTLVVEYGKST